MMTTLLLTLALAATLQDRTSIVHDFKADRALAYELTFNIKLPDGESVSRAQCIIKPLRSYQNGNTDIELHLDEVKFVRGDVEHAFKSVVFGFTLNKNGVPVDALFDGIESMATTSLIALFLPARQMAEGAKFDYRYDGDSLGLKFKGEFEEFVMRKGRRLVKLITVGTVAPVSEPTADITLTTLYDAQSKRVVEAHALIELPWGDIEVDMVAKD